MTVSARLLSGAVVCGLLATGCAGLPQGTGSSGVPTALLSTPSVASAAPVPPEPDVASPSPAATPVPATPAPEKQPDCAKLRCIALTFDDGPTRETGRLLDTLEREGVTATLFMVGKAASAHPGIVKRADAMGVEIGNHTSNHKQLNRQSDKVVNFEIADTQRRLRAITGRYPTWFRPPYAGRNKRTDAIAARHKLGVVTWTTSPMDWENKDAKTITRLVLSAARRNSIVLMHDSHSWTVKAVPGIIKGLKAKGYTLVTLTQLVGDPRPGKLYY